MKQLLGDGKGKGKDSKGRKKGGVLGASELGEIDLVKSLPTPLGGLERKPLPGIVQPLGSIGGGGGSLGKLSSHSSSMGVLPLGSGSGGVGGAEMKVTSSLDGPRLASAAILGNNGSTIAPAKLTRASSLSSSGGGDGVVSLAADSKADEPQADAK